MTEPTHLSDEELEMRQIYSGHDNCPEDRCALKALNTVLDSLEAARRELAERQWIPCSERLPHESDFYLVCDKEFGDRAVGEASFDVDTKTWRDRCWDGKWDDITGSVTHWQPLPQPPSEHSEGEQLK